MKKVLSISIVLMVSMCWVSHAADSKRPLYFRMVFGKESKSSMLVLVDESGGTGSGYDVVYVDENMNGDLTDDAAKKFPLYKAGRWTGNPNPEFEFKGPFKGEKNAKYRLNMHSLNRKPPKGAQETNLRFHWYLEAKGWTYFFINGRRKFFSSAADALKGTPVRLAGECKWEISSRVSDNKVNVSAGLKDDNGCTLRSVKSSKERLSPTLTLVKDGKVKQQGKMKFG